MTIDDVNNRMGLDYNCCQVVLYQLREALGISEEQANQLGVCFGGGMNKGETCGALIGAYTALGLKYGAIDYTDKKSKEKRAIFKKMEHIHQNFVAENGSTMCKEILSLDLSTKEGQELNKTEKRTSKICPQLILNTVNILKEMG